MEEQPPKYTPAVEHVSLVYVTDPQNQVVLHPLLLEINSTKLTLHHIHRHLRKTVAYHFNCLSPEFTDPVLLNKSLKASSSLDGTSKTPRRPASFSRFLSRFTPIAPSIKKIGARTDELSDYSNTTLSTMDSSKDSLQAVLRILNAKPDFNNILKPQLDSPFIGELTSMISCEYKSFSLQELLYFGNAIDYKTKPFALRLVFPDCQFIVNAYNANDYASIFYKLNIGKELSLDIEHRCLEPVDYCLPRRRRNRRGLGCRRRNRTRSNTVTSTMSVESTDSTDENLEASTPPAYTDVSMDDTNDFFDELQEIVPDSSFTVPVAHEISNTDTFSAITTVNSLFSTASIDRVETTRTSLSSPSFNSSYSTGSLKAAIDQVSQNSKYDDLVFALKCIKSCKVKKIWNN